MRRPSPALFRTRPDRRPRRQLDIRRSSLGPVRHRLARHDAARRHRRRTISVLQRRNGRGDRRQFLETVRPEEQRRSEQPTSDRAIFIWRRFAGRRRPEHVPDPASDRPDERAPAQAGGGARAGLCARERDLGQHRLLPRLGRASAGEPAPRLQGRPNAPPMEERRRFRPCGERKAHDLFRHQQRRTRCGWRMDAGPSQEAPRLHEDDRRRDRSGGVLQRADHARIWRRSRRL